MLKVENTIKGLDNESSIAILYDEDKELAKELVERNEKWRGPHKDNHFYGAEADVVVLVIDNNLILNLCARARRLLIIVTHGKMWNDKWHEWPMALNYAVSEGLVEKK